MRPTPVQVVPLGDGVDPVIEGVAGKGVDFRLVSDQSVALPLEMVRGVRNTLERLEDTLVKGVRIDWAIDAGDVCVLMLPQCGLWRGQRRRFQSRGGIIVAFI